MRGENEGFKQIAYLPPILLAFVILVIFSFNSTITKKKKKMQLGSNPL
jgi:hypothetical protein